MRYKSEQASSAVSPAAVKQRQSISRLLDSHSFTASGQSQLHSFWTVTASGQSQLHGFWTHSHGSDNTTGKEQLGTVSGSLKNTLCFGVTVDIYPKYPSYSHDKQIFFFNRNFDRQQNIAFFGFTKEWRL